MKWTSAAVNAIRPLSARACSAGVSGDEPPGWTLVCADWTAVVQAVAAAVANRLTATTDRRDLVMDQPSNSSRLGSLIRERMRQCERWKGLPARLAQGQ
jgi:hypothetical protein